MENINNPFFDENQTDKNKILLKSFIINFQIGDYKSSCIGEGNNALHAIKNAILLNPHGKNFVLREKPVLGKMSSMSTNKKV